MTGVEGLVFMAETISRECREDERIVDLPVSDR